ncbi:MAG: 5-methyltetrahydropteroyltriglutamate--homocysteine S-methyltransferase [Pseudomonadota bacterium]
MTLSIRNRPPFRAEHVGSLLRPKALLEARKRVTQGTLSSEQLHKLEDDAIRHAVRRQEEVGLQAVTDGEMRRTSWHMDFLCAIGGVIQGGTQLRPFENDTGSVRNEIALPKVTGDLHLERTIFEDHFKFLKSITKVVAKLAIPSPSILHGLGDTTFYKDEDKLFEDLIRVYSEQLRRLEEVGCTYLQIDDTMFAMLADVAYRNKIRSSSVDPAKRHLKYIELINRVVANRSPNLTVCVHTCRGNHRSAWVATGGYDPIAEAVFSDLAVDGLFLEFDDARSGGFEPLRFVPKGKYIVLGLVTSKRPQLENKDDLKRRIDAASKYVDLDQLCLSPQCGFASTSEGNLLTEEEQFAKLKLVVDTAREVWGST